MNGTVYVYKTSPKTLGSDVEKVLDTEDFQELNPEKETYIKINANRGKYHNILSEKLIELREHIQDITCGFFSIIDGTVELECGIMRLGDSRRVDLVLAGKDVAKEE